MEFLTPSDITEKICLPLFIEHIPCGFPSPTEDYIAGRIDLNKLLIKHPSATYFVKVSGDSMCGAGIHNGDLLVVDRALTARHGDIVVAAINGEFTVKELCTSPPVRLLAHNPAHPPLLLNEADNFTLFGVETFTIKATK